MKILLGIILKRTSLIVPGIRCDWRGATNWIVQSLTKYIKTEEGRGESKEKERKMG
jgi:hypothetical protein